MKQIKHYEELLNNVDNIVSSLLYPEAFQPMVRDKNSLLVRLQNERLYDGKIDMKHLQEERFEITELEKGEGRILSAIVHSRSLGKNIRLCM